MPASNVEVTAKFVKTGTTPVTPGTPGTPAKKVIQMQIGNKVIKVDGKDFVNDVAPVILNDRTIVPIRVITESLGGTVDWDASTKTVILHIDGKDIIMIIGMEITGYGVAPSILNDRTYVPIRVVADKLGAQTTWIAETKQVVIEK